MNKIEIGARVKYLREDPEHVKATGYYPPVGTLGTVVSNGRKFYGEPMVEVHWDSGTKDDGVWWCEESDVEVIS